MELLGKKPALEAEWEKVLKEEQQFLQKHTERKKAFINEKLEDKVPERLKETLVAAFAKAVALIFEKGTGIIEKTYNKENIQKQYQAKQYAARLLQDKKTLRDLSKGAAASGTKNTVVAGAAGIGMGLIGMGLPDIPVFTGMLLKNIYEITLHYGYSYESDNEKLFILLLLQGSVSYGEELKAINRQLNLYIANGKFDEALSVTDEINKAAHLLADELLYMKFLQGVPVVGAVGGFYDAVYMKRVNAYAKLKYRHRYLFDQRLLRQTKSGK